MLFMIYKSRIIVNMSKTSVLFNMIYIEITGGNIWLDWNQRWLTLFIKHYSPLADNISTLPYNCLAKHSNLSILINRDPNFNSTLTRPTQKSAKECIKVLNKQKTEGWYKLISNITPNWYRQRVECIESLFVCLFFF